MFAWGHREASLGQRNGKNTVLLQLIDLHYTSVCMKSNIHLARQTTNLGLIGTFSNTTFL